jgi:hypothetical protein
VVDRIDIWCYSHRSRCSSTIFWGS